MNRVRLAQLARIPSLVALLLAAVSAKPALAQSLTRLDYGAMWRPWLLLVVSGGLFAAVALWGRAARHPAAILAIEGLVAGGLGLLPPVTWISWFGVGATATFGVTTGNLFAQALALVWLVVVLITADRQRRRVTGRDREPYATPRASR